MRAIDSAINLSQALSQRLVVTWIINPALNCPLSELFLPSSTYSLVETTLSISNPRDWKYFFLVDRNRRLHLINTVASLARKILFERVIELEMLDDLVQTSFDFRELKEFERIYICTHNHFFRPKKMFAHFVLTEELKQRVDAVSAAFDDHTIGVHIRRGDSPKSISHSPLDAFVRVMNHEIRSCDKTTFYLATDCPATALRMKELFGPRILSFDRQYSRNTPDGIKDALVDLYCLSRTTRLLGSYWTSFSQTAAELTGIERTTVTSA
ncbi:MAG: hypothetical protein SWE60_01305 [Thermodesulfobacteriota bacterium]|nr:hypothetical protein [Thermodesulfobacteriota bacterium]